MEQKHNRWRNLFQFPLGIQLLCLFLAFILICTAFISIYSSAIMLSSKAKKLNDSVQLCRNVAEVYLTEQDPSRVVSRMGGRTSGVANVLCFDDNLALSDSSDYGYQISMKQEEQTLDAGEMRICKITAYCQGEEIYSLDVNVFIPEGGVQND